MFISEYRAKCWTKKQIRKNFNTIQPIDCEQYIHKDDRMALEALRKIPLLDTFCSKFISLVNDSHYRIMCMSSMIHITENQYSKVYTMVKSICKKLGIEMPELYLQLSRSPNAYTFGTENYTIVIHSGLLECLEDDELYAVLAHECGHIACKHMLYHTIAQWVFCGSRMGLLELSSVLSDKGLVGSIVGGALSAVDSALELALYHWYRCSELSADRVAVICCGSATPVTETMMRLAGGTKHINSEINTDLFIAQAVDYNQMVSEKKINKALEFLMTKNNEHPFLAVRALEAKNFFSSEKFKGIES